MAHSFLLSGVRTPIGAFQGALASFTAPQLGALAIREAIDRAGVSADELDEVLMGCVLTGGLGQAPARQASRGAGVPDSVPCTTVNKVCGSGMKTLMMADQAIRAGDASLIVAGGMESMSNAGYLLEKARTGYRMGHGQLLDLMIHDGLWDPYDNCHMGNCGDATSAQLGISREELDAYAAESYRRALGAKDRLSAEILPVSIPQRKGDPVIFDTDEEPAKGDPAKLPALRPAFAKDGVTTAGNASSLDDGAAAMVVASEAYVNEKGAHPLARIVATTQYAHQPTQFTTAPGFAVERLLAKAGLAVKDIDLFEINEAFSVVALGVARQVGIPAEKLNVNGGAVALGHPIGMTGARLVLTAAHELRRRGGRYAIASPCIGGGEATAVLIERV